MSISGISGTSAMQAALIQQQIDVAMLAKANNVAKDQGAAAVALIESAAELAETMPANNGSQQLNVVA